MTSSGWLPVRAYWQDHQACLDWCLFDKKSFTEPFFEQTVQRLLQHPFHHVFRQQTGINALADARSKHSSIAPTGFIFHMSRCGSTLLGQLLAGFPENIVLSEPPPLDFVLLAHYAEPATSQSQRIDWLRGMVNAFGQKRTGLETRLFVKFDAWHIHELPLIREAFPDVPWIFLYRNPIEVMVSHAKQPGSWMIPDIVQPSVLQVDKSDWIPGQQQDYCAKVLAKICQAGLLHSQQHDGLLLNYEELPNAFQTRLASPFNLSVDENTINKIGEISQFNAKTPGMSFKKDREQKQLSATEKMRELTARHLEPIYRQLEAHRMEQMKRF